MKSGRKLILKTGKTPVYIVKADSKVIWEGKDIHRRFTTLKAANKNKELTISWKTEQESIDV